MYIHALLTEHIDSNPFYLHLVFYILLEATLWLFSGATWSALTPSMAQNWPMDVSCGWGSFWGLLLL